MIDGVYDAATAKTELKAAQDKARYGAMDEKHVAREIKRLEKAMLDHARNLEFEEAARARDQLAQLRQQVFGATGGDNVVALDGNRAA